MIWLAHLPLPAIALWLLWPTPYRVLWWVTLALLVLDIGAAETVRTAARRHAKELGFGEIPLPLVPRDPVQQFWGKVNFWIALTIAIVSIVGITLAYRGVLLYWGIALTGGGVVGYVASKILMIRSIGESCPDVLDEDLESGPLPDGRYRWEHTSEMGIAPKSVSATRRLGIAAFAAGAIVLTIGLARRVFG
jgi:hypothetical protein